MRKKNFNSSEKRYLLPIILVLLILTTLFLGYELVNAIKLIQEYQGIIQQLEERNPHMEDTVNDFTLISTLADYMWSFYNITSWAYNGFPPSGRPITIGNLTSSLIHFFLHLPSLIHCLKGTPYLLKSIKALVDRVWYWWPKP